MTSKTLLALKDIELWMEEHDDYREAINRAVFGAANKMKAHPNDIAIYILTRTASI